MDPNILFFGIIAILLVCFFSGRRAGLICTLIPVVSALASFWLLTAAVPVFREDITGEISEFAFRDALIDVAAFAVSFFLLRWIIRRILKFFKLIGDAPVLGSVNRLLGGVVGFIGGLILIWGIFFFLLLFYGPQELPQFYNAIGQNEFVKLLYNNNLLMTFINFFIFT
ncbi:MAG: CvpA family protein [Lachnospiraceae bacterium]|nr:CvpA family protein [Lachnospiraceae bacterium]